MAKKIVMPRLGEYWEEQGGIRAGEMRGIGVPDYQLILPIGELVTGLKAKWGGAGKDEPGATCTSDGLKNTIALVESKISHPAAELCANLTVECFSDLYLPSRREARLLWINAGDHIDTDGWYWTSTQYSPHYAYDQGFASGGQYGDRKVLEARVRPVRRFTPLDI